jgi:hypothetical protein
MPAKSIRFIAIAAAAATAMIQSASAATVQLQQFWDAAAQPNVLGEFTTYAIWDDSSITGVGAERVYLDTYYMARTLNGVGQSAEFALLPDPADVFPLQLNSMVASYNNGVLQGVGVLAHSSSGFVSLSFDRVSPSGTGVGFRQAGPEFQLIYALPVSGIWYFNLDDSRTVLTTSAPLPTPVPIPGAALLFAFGVAMIGLFGGRSRQHRRRATGVPR